MPDLNAIGSHPAPAFAPIRVRATLAVATTPTKIVEGSPGRLVDIKDIQVSLAADATVIVREESAGPVLIRQKCLAGSTPLPPARSTTPGASIEIVSDTNTVLNVDGIARYF